MFKCTQFMNSFHATLIQIDMFADWLGGFNQHLLARHSDEHFCDKLINQRIEIRFRIDTVVKKKICMLRINNKLWCVHCIHLSFNYSIL